MNFSFYIARRYLVSKNGKNAINVINILSFIITVVGTSALFIVLSGFSGLKDFSTAFSNYFDPDLEVSPLNGKVIEIPLSRKLELQNIEGISTVSLFVEEKVFLYYDNKNAIAYIKGVDKDFQNIIEVDSITYYGNWLTDNDFQVVVGAAIADDLSLSVNNYGRYLNIMVPKPGENAINALNYKNSFSQIDVLALDMYGINENLDNKYVFSTITAARDLLNYSDSTATGIAIKLNENTNEDAIRSKIKSVLGDNIIIKNKLQQNDALYKMLNSENMAVYLIFTLVLIIALFNVVGAIIMMILDKKKNMKTLLDLGAEVSDLRKIFFIQGSLMTLIGGIIGLVIGIAVVMTQIKLKLVYIAPQIPYPFAMDYMNVVVSLVTIAILGVIASYVASRRINDRLMAQAKL